MAVYQQESKSNHKSFQSNGRFQIFSDLSDFQSHVVWVPYLFSNIVEEPYLFSNGSHVLSQKSQLTAMSYLVSLSWFATKQGRRKHLKLGGTIFQWHNSS